MGRGKGVSFTCFYLSLRSLQEGGGGDSTLWYLLETLREGCLKKVILFLGWAEEGKKGYMKCFWGVWANQQIAWVEGNKHTTVFAHPVFVGAKPLLAGSGMSFSGSGLSESTGSDVTGPTFLKVPDKTCQKVPKMVLSESYWTDLSTSSGSDLLESWEDDLSESSESDRWKWYASDLSESSRCIFSESSESGHFRKLLIDLSKSSGSVLSESP